MGYNNAPSSVSWKSITKEDENDYEPEEGWENWLSASESVAPEAPKEPVNRSFLEELMHQLKDAAPQPARVGTHALGAYGNIESMLKGGLRKIGLSERYLRSPQYFPTTEDVEREFGAPHKPTTGLGEFTARASGLVGDVLPLSVPGPHTLPQALQNVAAAGAGHIAEKSSDSPIAGVLAELGTLAYLNTPKGHFQSFEGKHGEHLRELEKMGLSEPSLIMTGRALDKNKGLFKGAGSSLEPYVENMSAEANEAYHSFFRNTLPPSEEALDAFFTEAYGALEQEAKSIEMPKGISVSEDVKKLGKEVYAGTIKHPEAEAQHREIKRSAKRIEKGRSRVKIEPTPEEIAQAKAEDKPLKVKHEPLTAHGVVKDVRNINSHYEQNVKHEATLQQAEKYKNTLYDVLAEAGPEGKALVEKLRELDQKFIKSLDQKKAMKIADNWMSADGLDWDRVQTSLNNASQREALIKATSPEHVKKLKELSEAVRSVKKAYGSGGNSVANVLAALGGGAATQIGKSIMSGTFKMEDLLGPAVIGVSALASRYLAKQMLTNPKYQNLGIELARAVKRGAVRTALLLRNDIREELQKDSAEWEENPS